METVLNKLIDSLNNGNILLAMIIVAVAILFNYRKIVSFFDDRRKARILKLTEALSNEHITGLTKDHLKEELATEQFKLSTGIRLEKEFREALIKAHINTKGELSFVHFKRALPHIKYKDESLVVNITTIERIIYWFNSIFGILMIVCGLFLLVLPGQADGFSFIQSVSIFSMGVMFVVFAMFMLFQTFPVYSAKLVSEELEKSYSNLNW